MKPPNCTAKEIFVIKESSPIRNASKRMKQILDAEYKKIWIIIIIGQTKKIVIRIASEIWRNVWWNFR